MTEKVEKPRKIREKKVKEEKKGITPEEIKRFREFFNVRRFYESNY